MTENPSAVAEQQVLTVEQKAELKNTIIDAAVINIIYQIVSRLSKIIEIDEVIWHLQKIENNFTDERDTPNPNDIQIFLKEHTKDFLPYFISTLHQIHYNPYEASELEETHEKIIKRCIQSMNILLETSNKIVESVAMNNKLTQKEYYNDIDYRFRAYRIFFETLRLQILKSVRDIFTNSKLEEIFSKAEAKRICRTISNRTFFYQTDRVQRSIYNIFNRPIYDTIKNKNPEYLFTDEPKA